MCPGGVAGGDRGGVEEGAVRKGARNHVLAVALSDQHCPAAHGSIDQLYCIVFHRWERAQQTVRERAEKIPSVGAAKTEVVLLNIPVVPAPMLVCCNACSLLHRIKIAVTVTSIYAFHLYYIGGASRHVHLKRPTSPIRPRRCPRTDLCKITTKWSDLICDRDAIRPHRGANLCL
jgi:hypothetical protein